VGHGNAGGSNVCFRDYDDIVHITSNTSFVPTDFQLCALSQTIFRETRRSVPSSGAVNNHYPGKSFAVPFLAVYIHALPRSFHLQNILNFASQPVPQVSSLYNKSAAVVQTMRLPAGPHRSLPQIFLTFLLLTAHISPVYSIPQHLSRRQSSFETLQLPKCALTCLLNGILSDGCANESDFACHCGPGNIIGKMKGCIEQGCGEADQKDAMVKLRSGCSVLGGSGSSRVGGLMSRAVSSSIVIATTSPTPSPSPSSLSSTLSRQFTFSPSGTSSRAPSSTISPAPTATKTPLAPAPVPAQLSDAAKAGIAVSICSLGVAVFLALGWYIRRLKRDLKAAQTTERRPSMSTTIPTPQRSRSTRQPPSPEILTVSNNGYGVLKKKRGHVLSMVAEASEEHLASEPVPGQREGLAAPLELDAETTRIVEMPLSVTPRSRSRER
jgi:hypothetical protein